MINILLTCSKHIGCKFTHYLRFKFPCDFFYVSVNPGSLIGFKVTNIGVNPSPGRNREISCDG